MLILHCGCWKPLRDLPYEKETILPRTPRGIRVTCQTWARSSRTGIPNPSRSRPPPAAASTGVWRAAGSVGRRTTFTGTPRRACTFFHSKINDWRGKSKGYRRCHFTQDWKFQAAITSRAPANCPQNGETERVKKNELFWQYKVLNANS